MELTQQVPKGSLQIVQSYGADGFKVSGRRHQGSILILPNSTRDWSVDSAAEITLPSLQPVIDAEPAVELLIIGCGANLARLPVTLLDVLKTKAIGVEAMDTGAACRTYNVLAGEGRRVGAALVGL